MPERWALVLVVTLLRSVGGCTENGSPEGRRVAARSELPYVCSVRLHGVHRCSAAILNTNWLLTSGQCTVDGRTGSTVDTLATVCGVHMFRNVGSIVLHPNFDAGHSTGNDLALLMMRKPLNFTSNVQAIPLFDSDELSMANTGKVTIVGFESLAGGSGPDSVWWNPPLQLAEVTILTSCECQARLGPNLTSYLTDGTICTDNGSASCVGDTGAPLMIATEQQPYTLVAISSWTVTPCGTGPMVHVRVAPHLDWILDVMAIN